MPPPAAGYDVLVAHKALLPISVPLGSSYLTRQRDELGQWPGAGTEPMGASAAFLPRLTLPL